MKIKLKTQNSKLKTKIKSLKSLGFTLIELLVVISIIGILAALLTSSFSQAQKQSRDAKRKGDMKSVQNAFEQYSVTNGRYPENVTEANALFQDSILPVDPLNTATNYYKLTYNATGASYCVCAYLEIPGKGNATDYDCTMGTGNYACVKNLQ